MLTTVAAGRVFDYSYCLGMYGMSGQGFWTPQDMALANGSNGDAGTVYVIIAAQRSWDSASPV